MGQHLKQIHNLLFTNDEIDIQKITCLYLISAHRTETLAPQPKKSFHLYKTYSPMDRLLNRSKKKNSIEAKLIQSLPLYTLELPDLDETKKDETKINDGRLATRILLNEKIRGIVNSVLTALKQANIEKFEEILEIMNDPESLESTFESKHVSKFLEELKHFKVITSCEFFVLTPPYKTKSIRLPIKTKDGILEKLLKDIRQNLLQTPLKKNVKQNQGDALGDSEELLETSEQIELGNKIETGIPNKTMVLAKPPPPNKQVIKESVTMDPKELREYHSSINFEAQKNRSSASGNKVYINVSTETNPISTNASSKELVENLYRNMKMTRNFVKKNITEAGTAKRMSSLLEVDNDEENENIEVIKHKNKRFSEALRRNPLSNYSANYDDYYSNLEPIMLKEKMLNKIGRYEKNNVESNKKDAENDEDAKKKSEIDTKNIKVTIKQTKCLACMEKWKIPLPHPKTPAIKKNLLLPQNQLPHLQVNTQRRVSALIDREMFKLQLYERKLSEDNARKAAMRRKAIENDTTDYVNLSPIELAKIEQQVREKETHKKIQRFLTE